MSRRDTKPYSRPDVDGQWKHDLHQTAQSTLLDRIAPSPGQSLASRIAGGKKELFPDSSSSRGSGRAADRGSKAGVELLPAGEPAASQAPTGRARGGPVRGVGVNQKSRELLNDALGVGARRSTRPQQSRKSQVSIIGAAKTTVWVRVENLAPGTTAEDVVSAFAPLPILNATQSNLINSPTVSIDLELENRNDAEELIKQYNGVVADGNTLRVSIVNNLKHRLGGGSAVRIGANTDTVAGQELLSSAKSSKLYSDMVLATDPNATIITVAEEPSPSSFNASRGTGGRGGRGRPANALAARMGNGGARGWAR
ncbi:Hypothetical Protein CGB_D3330C [Cryptococcus gattii WM276]|uniref:RRM domain-containing protein n=1 Tax=Cryptococcus gattii serotype B (strain WM276 / ATCC MYA-4071) TaxID=367775 RepID=E6R3N4_CRYGW|nr:Hypothetical Protein CGB_D3330C [Cryptococcus gattii WM276]ADV21736.1 Hypothetical Protein CGB_D3330C [Cryptococcus gattii WM276]